jgi:hypothetical protein
MFTARYRAATAREPSAKPILRRKVVRSARAGRRGAKQKEDSAGAAATREFVERELLKSNVPGWPGPYGRGTPIATCKPNFGSFWGMLQIKASQ